MSRQKLMIDRLRQAQLDALSPSSTSEAQAVHASLFELDDLDMLPGILEEPVEGDGLLELANDVELSMALWAANELGIHNDISAIIDKVDHEREHAVVAPAIGLTAIHAVRFKLLASGNLGMKVTTIPVGEQVTKLGFAAMLARPQRLSRSDQRQIRMIGYQDQYDIAERIDETGLNVPRPLSVR
jgi:hypothetical protein